MVSEIDINDWERTEEVQKLYDVKRDSIVSVATDYGKHLPFIFKKVDGIYSLCYELDEKSPYHPAAWTEVYLWKKK